MTEGKLNKTPPLIMGVINLSSASFSPVGRINSVEEALAVAQKIIAEGADMIDVGAEPTNPVNPQHVVTEEQELATLIPVIQALRAHFDIPLSVDTSRPFVMQAAIEAGANIINDVRALRVPGAVEMVAALNVPVCLMHMRFLKLPDQTEVSENTQVGNKPLMQEIGDFLAARIAVCIKAGIKRENLIIDPGIGAGCFGKNSIEENLTILRELPQLKQFNLPILIGVSRKLFIGDLLQAPVEERLVGSLVAALAAIRGGADIIRVHDVRATAQAIKMMSAIEQDKR